MIHIGFYLRVATIIIDALAAATGASRVQRLLLRVEMAAGAVATAATTRATVVRDCTDRLVLLVGPPGNVLLRLQQTGVLRTALGVAAVVPAAARERIVATLELAGDLLVGGAPPRHQHHVEPGQAKDRDRQQRYDGHQDHSHDRFHLGQLVLLLLQHVDQRQGEDAQHVDRQRDQKEEEEAIVPPADAVVHPRAVVVKGLNAVIADGAVRAPGRPVELARDAPLHAHRNAVDFGIFVQRRPELVLAVFVGGCFRYDAGIHEGGQREVGDDEERDDGLVRRNPWVPLDVELATWIVEEQERRAQQQRPGEGRWDVSRFDITFRHYLLLCVIPLVLGLLDLFRV